MIHYTKTAWFQLVQLVFSSQNTFKPISANIYLFTQLLLDNRKTNIKLK